MPQIADATVQTAVTSPPYFGLRSYVPDGHADKALEIGLEPTVEAYVTRLVGVFREVRRVLRDDGVLWLNLGDSYATSGTRQGNRGAAKSLGKSPDEIYAHASGYRGRPEGLKEKDLIGVPWCVAFALQADGWWLRDAIVWHKPNPMPSSVSDRCTPSYELIFMLTKSAQYYFDAKAISETARKVGSAAHLQGGRGARAGTRDGLIPRKSASLTVLDPIVSADPTANKRNVWTIATAPYNDAHFATFPPELPATCIAASSRVGDLILDPFMGSGTVAEVAESMGRRWVGYELSKEYHKLIRERTRQRGLFGS